jgi:hypothetical protein
MVAAVTGVFQADLDKDQEDKHQDLQDQVVQVQQEWEAK